MINKMVLGTAVIGITAMVASSTVAQANPSTPMPVIESSAAQLCGAIEAHPTPGGLIDGMGGLEGKGLDEMDQSLVLITAMHHVCPQHQPLIMGLVEPIAADELCSKPA